jgi:MoaA/NifB/PqqE/SkfB family radical SAM enzyme/ubiquinone/menaquinone biosynthesis C-methylase UbiE
MQPIDELELKDNLILHAPALTLLDREGLSVFVDGEAPNWAALDERGAAVLSLFDGKRSLGEVRRLYAASSGAGAAAAWLDVHSLSRELLRQGILSDSIRPSRPYAGRAAYLAPKRLGELWVHLLQTCNISCSHCLVSSGPQGEKGPEAAFLTAVIEQAHVLGARRFYFTGGEPFVRQDLFDLIHFVVEDKSCELVVMTNATLLTGPRLEKLKAFNRSRLKFQVSLDGATAPVNDAIRGQRVFEKASQGLKALSGLGFETSLTAVVTRANLKDLEGLPDLAFRLGAKSVHLMWAHKRGRIVEGADPFPSNAELLALARTVRDGCRKLGLILDNTDSLRRRADGRPGVKNDLGNQCWESLCLYRDGLVYPSAAMAGLPELCLGDARALPLKSLWLESPVARHFRQASLASKATPDPLRFLTGGGDVEHSYFFSANGHTGSLVGHDPYHELLAELMQDEIFSLASDAQARFNAKSGFRPPVIIRAMGEGALTCSEDALAWLEEEGGRESQVRLTHSNCVLSFDVEKPYRIVQKFYGGAAVQPQKELCCPVKYSNDEVGHIPQDVLDRFYGCGSPISQAGVQEGETTLDLGSGAGIDCFIAAKKVGPAGKVIGVDMTAEMLAVARRCQKEVAANLGYDVVEFREGYLECAPIENKSVDLVTSNCVINLSPDKGKVFSEIWRILKDNGRLVVADIVADRPVPLNLQAHKDLWGECISGSLSEAEFMAGLEKAGFYGLSLLKKTFWKEVEGYKFYSITVRGFKFEKKAGCRFTGQKALYAGPYKAVIDEEGHLFPRGEAVEVCTDTAAKLMAPPYEAHFDVLEPDGSAAAEDKTCCSPGASCC